MEVGQDRLDIYENHPYQSDLALDRSISFIQNLQAAGILTPSEIATISQISHYETGGFNLMDNEHSSASGELHFLDGTYLDTAYYIARYRPQEAAQVFSHIPDYAKFASMSWDEFKAHSSEILGSNNQHKDSPMNQAIVGSVFYQRNHAILSQVAQEHGIDDIAAHSQYRDLMYVMHFGGFGDGEKVVEVYLSGQSNVSLASLDLRDGFFSSNLGYATIAGSTTPRTIGGFLAETNSRLNRYNDESSFILAHSDVETQRSVIVASAVGSGGILAGKDGQFDPLLGDQGDDEIQAEAERQARLARSQEVQAEQAQKGGLSGIWEKIVEIFEELLAPFFGDSAAQQVQDTQQASAGDGQSQQESSAQQDLAASQAAASGVVPAEISGGQDTAGPGGELASTGGTRVSGRTALGVGG